MVSNDGFKVRDHLPILYSNQKTLDLFPQSTISVTYKRNKNYYFLGLPKNMAAART